MENIIFSRTRNVSNYSSSFNRVSLFSFFFFYRTCESIFLGNLGNILREIPTFRESVQVKFLFAQRIQRIYREKMERNKFSSLETLLRKIRYDKKVVQATI